MIKAFDNKVTIYQIHNQQRQKEYNLIEELLNNYTIYGETIKENENIGSYVKENNIDYVVFIPAQLNNSFSINQTLLHLGY